MSDTKTYKKGTEFFTIEGGGIVAHDLIGNAFYTEQLHQMVPQVGKTHGLDLEQEGELTEVITDQNIQPAIHVEVIHCNPLPGLLWHIMSLQGLFGRLRLADTFLAPPSVICYVCIQPLPI